MNVLQVRILAVWITLLFAPAGAKAWQYVPTKGERALQLTALVSTPALMLSDGQYETAGIQAFSVASALVLILLNDNVPDPNRARTQRFFAGFFLAVAGALQYGYPVASMFQGQQDYDQGRVLRGMVVTGLQVAKISVDFKPKPNPFKNIRPVPSERSQFELLPDGLSLASVAGDRSEIAIRWSF